MLIPGIADLMSISLGVQGADNHVCAAGQTVDAVLCTLDLILDALTLLHLEC